jgi:hypothetical protein
LSKIGRGNVERPLGEAAIERDERCGVTATIGEERGTKLGRPVAAMLGHRNPTTTLRWYSRKKSP